MSESNASRRAMRSVALKLWVTYAYERGQLQTRKCVSTSNLLKSRGHFTFPSRLTIRGKFEYHRYSSRYYCVTCVFVVIVSLALFHLLTSDAVGGAQTVGHFRLQTWTVTDAKICFRVEPVEVVGHFTLQLVSPGKFEYH